MCNPQIHIILCVVIEDQAGHLLETVRLKFNHRLRFDAESLLPAGHQTLPVAGAQRFHALQPQEARPLAE
ncbi:hypothetical protein D3C80_2174630 [compost metagenome]